MTCSLTELCQSDDRRAGSQPRPASEMGGKVRKSTPELDHCCCRGQGAAKRLGRSKWDVKVAERGSKHRCTLPQLWAGAPSEQERSRGHAHYPKRLRGLCLHTSSRTLGTSLGLTDSTGLTFTLTERGAQEETGGISGAMEATGVLWPFRR